MVGPAIDTGMGVAVVVGVKMEVGVAEGVGIGVGVAVGVGLGGKVRVGVGVSVAVEQVQFTPKITTRTTRAEMKERCISLIWDSVRVYVPDLRRRSEYPHSRGRVKDHSLLVIVICYWNAGI